MISLHRSLKLWQKIPSVSLIFGLLIAYLLCFYHYAAEVDHQKVATLFLQTENEVNTALNTYVQYLDLTSDRLARSHHDRDWIPKILATRVEQLVGTLFPEIISLTFTPVSEPRSEYSMLGKKSLDQNDSLGTKDESVYLGNGEFKVIKVLMDHDKPFGYLRTTFSIHQLLFKNFSKDEIGIYPQLSDGKPHFKVPHTPYVCMLTRKPFAVGQFMAQYRNSPATSISQEVKAGI